MEYSGNTSRRNHLVTLTSQLLKPVPKITETVQDFGAIDPIKTVAEVRQVFEVFLFAKAEIFVSGTIQHAGWFRMVLPKRDGSRANI